MVLLLLALLGLQESEPSKIAEAALEAFEKARATGDPLALERRVWADWAFLYDIADTLILRAVEGRAGEGNADTKPLHALLEAAQNRKDPDARAKKRIAMIRLRTALADKLDKAAASEYLAEVHRFEESLTLSRTDNSAALKALEKSAEKFKAIGDPYLRFACLNYAGRILIGTGHTNRAAEFFDEARSFMGEIGVLEVEATVTGNYAFCILNQGRLNEAIKLLETARDLAREANDKGLEGTFIGNIGLAFHFQGRSREAAAIYEESLELQKSVGNQEAVFLQHGNIALALQAMGRYRDAMIRYEMALEQSKTLGNRMGQATVMGNLALLHMTCGRFGAAEENLRGALEIYRAEENKTGESMIVGNLGSVYLSLGRIEEARPQFQCLHDLSVETGNAHGVALALLNLACVDMTLKHYDLAIEGAEKARKQCAEIGNRAGECYALLALAQSRLLDGKPEQARPGLEDALRIAQDLESRDLEGSTLALLGELDLDAGRVDEAVRNLEDAQRAFETVRASFGMLSEEKLAWFSGRREAYETAVRAYVRAGRHRDAFFLLEQMRARSLQDTLGRSRKGSDTPPELLDARSKLSLEYNARHREVNQLSASQSPKDKLLAAREAFRRVEEQIRENSHKIELSQTLEEARPLSAGEVQRVLKDGEAVVLFNVAERGDRILCALVLRRDVKVLELPKDESFDRQVRWIRDAAAATRQGFPAAQYRKRAQALYTALFGKIEKDLRDIRTLILCPDEGLYGVPFEALVTGGGDDYASLDYLGKKFEVRTASCATLMARRRAEFGSPQGKGLIVFGDPDYPTRQPQADRGLAPPELPEDLKEFVRVGDDVRSGWARLPHSGDEARAIAALFKTEPLLGPKASESAAKKMDGARYLHFACHGYFDAEDPLKSALILTADGDSDGYLEAREIVDLKLQAELVVLSACDTARGETLPGEGLIGLTRALMIAGARSVVASLWSVSDEAGKEFMVRFYTKIAAGREKSAALAETKREFMTHARYSAPYYWAAFVLHGD